MKKYRRVVLPAILLIITAYNNNNNNKHLKKSICLKSEKQGSIGQWIRIRIQEGKNAPQK